MRTIHLVCVGKTRSASVRALCADYLSRVERYAKVEYRELRDADVETESKRIAATLQTIRGRRVLLTEHGATLTSGEFARWLAPDQPDIVFAVGGAYGFSTQLLEEPFEHLALSPMTLTHELSRLILLEQIYRGFNILSGTGYHH